jgi:putative phosphoesterase
MRLGVVSDTHGYFEPRLKDFFQGVDAILHAGDVGSPGILDELRSLAPVHAVQGNIDTSPLELPPSLTLDFDNVQVQIVHQLSVPQAEMKRWSDGALLGKLHPERLEAFLDGFGEATRVIVFGHSHQPCLMTLGHKLFFNPGSAGKQRFSLPRSCGLLEVYPRGVRGTLMSLERYNERLPGKIWLPIGG